MLGMKVKRIVKIVPISRMVAIMKFFKLIELKLDMRHWDKIEIQNCKNCFAWLSKIDTMVAILKFFK